MGAAALEEWVSNHSESFPPIVINITDGMATDGDPENFALRIMDLATTDGNVLVFNAHLSSVGAMPALFPSQVTGLPDEYATKLFRMSSVLPESCRNLAATQGIPVDEGSRGFVFNANLEALVQFLDIGTTTQNSLR